MMVFTIYRILISIFREILSRILIITRMFKMICYNSNSNSNSNIKISNSKISNSKINIKICKISKILT